MQIIETETTPEESLDSQLLSYIAETQSLFQLGNDLNTRLVKLENELKDLNKYRNEYEQKLNLLNGTSQKLYKIIQLKTNNISSSQILINNDSNNVNDNVNLVNQNLDQTLNLDTNNLENFTNAVEMEIVLSPKSPSIIKKKEKKSSPTKEQELNQVETEKLSEQESNQIETEKLSEQESNQIETEKLSEQELNQIETEKLSEEDAYDKLLLMMREDDFKENHEETEQQLNNLENDQNIKEQENKSPIADKLIKNSLSSSTLLSSLPECKVNVKKLDLSSLSIPLSQESKKLINSESFGTILKERKNSIDIEDKEDKYINNLCNFDLDKILSKKQLKEKKREKKIAILSNIPRSSKSADLDLISSDDSEIDDLEENAHVENIELADDNLNDELKEKEKRLFEMMNEDDFSDNLNDKESEFSFSSEPYTPKKKGRKKNNKKRKSECKKKNSILEPDLRIDLNTTDDEENKELNKKDDNNLSTDINNEINVVSSPNSDTTLVNEELNNFTDEEDLIGSNKKKKEKSKKLFDSDEDDDWSNKNAKNSFSSKKKLIDENQSTNETETDDDKKKSLELSDQDNLEGEDKKKKKKLKLPYLRGIFSNESNETNEPDDEILISENEDDEEDKEKVDFNLDESSKNSIESESKLNLSNNDNNKKRRRIIMKTSESESGSEASYKPKKKINKKIKKEYDDETTRSESSESDSDLDKTKTDGSDLEEIGPDENSPSKDTRHKLRNIIDDGKLTKETQDAIQAERERKKRIEEKRALEEELNKSGTKGLCLDIDLKTKKPLIKVDEAISKLLKPHQIEGVKFMWDSCFEKVEMIQKGDKGSGCLLAHCMGLGKTLQVITLVHTLLTNRNLTQVKRVLILLPINVLTNWRKEFNYWTKNCKNQIKIYELPTEKGKVRDLVRARLIELKHWFKHGGVLLMGYTIFARLVQGQSVKPKRLLNDFQKYLISPGPDLVICDEGHMLKTVTTNLTKSLLMIKTNRRIVLTGTPLQNNLIEYHCMVSFVKPSLLGTLKEFKNRFVNPINNGQHKDSTETDVRYMKKRAHVLHNLLDGCVQRKDYNVIRDLLKPKKEYVISVRLSDKQIELYRSYISHRGININNFGKMGGAQLFTDFQELSRICSHPWLIKLNEIRTLRIKEKAINFIVDDDENEETDKASNGTNETEDDDILDITVKKKKKKAINGGGLNKNVNQDVAQNENGEVTTKTVETWWSSLINEDCEYDINLGGKMVLLAQILKLCHEKGDKLLVFSQSLLSLEMIEKFLEHLTTTKEDCWKKDIDYFRMDGTTDIQKRKRQVDQFNDTKNFRCRLFLISTKAGGIGINLVGANRSIIFDATWNPSYDTQSIFRIYRFGQTKNVYVYRFLAQGTMEEKIYKKQVNKQSLSQRVIDEHQLDRHFTSQELREFYAFEPDIWNAAKKPDYSIPEDDLLKSLLFDCQRWIFKYHEHDSLLENKLNEGLSEEERKAAWDEYENEKQNRYSFNNFGTNLNATFQPEFSADSVLLNDNPNFTSFVNNSQLQNQIQANQRQLLAERLKQQINQIQQNNQFNQPNQMLNIQQLNNFMNNQMFKNPSVNNVVQKAQQIMRTNGNSIRIPISQNQHQNQARTSIQERPMSQTQFVNSVLGNNRLSPRSNSSVPNISGLRQTEYLQRIQQQNRQYQQQPQQQQINYGVLQNDMALIPGSNLINSNLNQN